MEKRRNAFRRVSDSQKQVRALGAKLWPQDSVQTIRKAVNSISLEPDTAASRSKGKGGPAKEPALVPALSFLVSALIDSTARC